MSVKSQNEETKARMSVRRRVYVQELISKSQELMKIV